MVVLNHLTDRQSANGLIPYCETIQKLLKISNLREPLKIKLFAFNTLLLSEQFVFRIVFE